MTYKGRDIRFPFPKRRDNDRKYVQPEPEVFTEGSFPDHVFKVTVGCSDDSYINLYRTRSSDPLELFLLQDTQHFHLRLERQLPYLIQKNGPLVSTFENAAF